MLETQIETSNDSQELMLELVEAGVKYRCRFDLSTGQATLAINDIEPRDFDPSEDGSVGVPTAATSVINGARHDLRFSNCDDQLLLWVDGYLVEFDRPTTFDSRNFRTIDESHPMYLPEHPLDGAPVGLAVRGGDANVTSLRIYRDKYYIATTNSNYGIYDYDMNKLWQLTDGAVSRPIQIQEVLADPTTWNTFPGWSARRTVEFELGEDQFFPMGDNSPESLDARCWAGSKPQRPLPRGVNEDAWRWSNDYYVPRDLLVGKALVVFWPHSWNSPVPLLPNFDQMKLIR
jgi:signal peptidase I